MSFINRENGYPVRHFGTADDGEIVSSLGLGDIQSHGYSSLPLPVLHENLKKHLGEPWIYRFNGPMDGFTAQQLNWVYNDSLMLDAIHGEGTYAEVIASFPEAAIYATVQRAATPWQRKTETAPQ